MALSALTCRQPMSTWSMILDLEYLLGRVQKPGQGRDLSVYEPASPNSVSTDRSQPPHVVLDAADGSSLKRLPLQVIGGQSRLS